MSAVKAIARERWDDPIVSAPVRGAVEIELENLKGRLLHPILEKITDSALLKEVLWAANEAAALAWCTVCPVLMLPLLLEEKIKEAIAKWEKQQRVRREVFKRHKISEIRMGLLVAAA
jgi:hypothetical protein